MKRGHLRPTWSRDWAGFSGGWYPTNEWHWQASIIGIHDFGYFVDVMAPLLGDVRVGFHTKGGMRNPHHSPSRQPKRIVLERRPR